MSNGEWIPVRKVEGKASRQAHCDLPDGTYEREISKEGFFGPASMVYHPKPPTGWSDFEGPLRPRAFDLNKLPSDTPSLWASPQILKNVHCETRFWRLDKPMPRLLRNADGDQLLFVHSGQGDLFCDYGHMAFQVGDYIVLPRGTVWRLEPKGTAEFLTIEATNGHYKLPDKGLVGQHAIFDPNMLDTPAINATFKGQQGEGEWKIDIKKRGAVSTVTYPYNPLDAVGWAGNLAPVRINVADIRPLMSARFHLPPSAHTTFMANRFVVCTFAPRPFETDPGAIKIPFFHNNDDYDEVIFYHAGDFFSRDNIHPGMMTFHPTGFTHGPHPKALEKMLVQSKPATDEYAVMIDTRDPLDVVDSAEPVEWTGYVDSWKPAKTTETA